MALKVTNGFKQYGKGNLVLNNLSMEVGHGQIYGLLGASGCGKTTLLSCVVGLRKLDAGEIIIFAQERHGRLGYLCGYMPQELALLDALSIKEVLRYFGMIYGLTGQEAECKIEFLSTFLDLPPISSPIQKLSGGQKRRVSLAVSMIHNPSLLVLDEPTVGLDPVLRHKIWEHLFELARVNGTTIIISTHYIEETKRCDKIGFMRGGQLLAEEPPSSLLSKFKTDSLQDVVLQLCRQDVSKDSMENNNYFAPTLQHEGVEIKSFRKVSISLQDHKHTIVPPVVKTNHFSIIHALVKKCWHRHLRDWRLFVGEFFLPVLAICILQNTVGLNPQNVKIGVVANANFTNDITEYCTPERLSSSTSGCFENTGICDFLGKFEHNEFDWVPLDSYADAENSIRRGSIQGLVEFPPGFKNFTKQRLIYRNFASNETIKGSTIAIRMDIPSIKSSWASGVLAEGYLNFIAAIGNTCSVNGDNVRPPMKYNAIYGSADIGSWNAFMQPGVLILFVFMLSTAICVVIIEDRKQGLEDRDHVAGVTMWHQMAGTFIAQSVLSLGEIAVFLAFFSGVYGMDVKGSWVLAVCLLFLAATTALSIGFLLATVLDELLGSVSIVLFLTLTQCMSSGILFPLELVVSGYQMFPYALPATFISEAFRSICTRGWGLEQYVVARGFVTAIGWMLVCLVLSMLANRRRHI